jgi:hypothetical protein
MDAHVPEYDDQRCNSATRFKTVKAVARHEDQSWSEKLLRFADIATFSKESKEGVDAGSSARHDEGMAVGKFRRFGW